MKDTFIRTQNYGNVPIREDNGKWIADILADKEIMTPYMRGDKYVEVVRKYRLFNCKTFGEDF